MKQKLSALLIIPILLLIAGCKKTDERMPDFRVDFATVVEKNGALSFLLDNQKLLTPQASVNYLGKPGQRVIINYILSEGETVEIKKVTDIFTGNIENAGYPDKLHKDPVAIRSIWVSGGYLNVIFEIEYHSKKHEIALFRNFNSPSIDLYFSHSKNNDLPGYTQTQYASFSLKNITNSGAQPFYVFIETSKGVRKFTFAWK